MATKIKAEDKALNKLTPQARDTVIAYTDPDSPTYGVKGRSVETGYPNMTPVSANAHGTDLFNRPLVRTAIAEILDARGQGYEVRANHTGDLALGNLENQTVTEQFKVGPKGKKTVVNRTVVTSPVPASVQLAALKKLSKDTGEDAVVGVQNKLIHKDLMKMGEDMLKDHQRALESHSAPVAPTDVDSPSETPQEA